MSRFHWLSAGAILVAGGALALGAWPVAAVVVLAHVAVTAAGVTFPQLGLFLPLLCRVPTARQAVALTFDDGPDPAVTPALLARLDAAGVKATFFCVGERVAVHPDLARQIVAAGHLVGNHSYRHAHGTNWMTTARLREDVTRAQEEIARVTGQRPVFFRPPMGLTNPRVARVVPALGLTAVGWSVRGLDRGQRTPAAIVARIARRLQPGAIIVLHDGGVPATVLLPAVDALLAELRQRGYGAERLDRLLEPT